MKALVVYESIYGNTQAIAAAIGAGLRTRAGAEVELVEVGSAPDAEPYDLVAVGGPIHAWGMGESRELARAGYRLLADPEHFLVEGKEGPLKEGEVERAFAWGVALGEAADR